jgi:hypothetical protein
MLILTAAPVSAHSAKPRVAGLVPASLIAGLPSTVGAASALLGLDRAQFAEHGDGTLQADLDLPAGTWRYWPGAGVALWIGRRGATPPTAPGGAVAEQIDLAEAVTNLYEAGHWIAEVRVLDANGWSRPLRLRDALGVLTDPAFTILAISGIWSDSIGAARVEIFTTGQVWADDPVRAERFILVATGRES